MESESGSPDDQPPGTAPANERRIPLNQHGESLGVFGHLDCNLRLIQKEFGASVVVRDDQIVVTGSPDQVERTARVLEEALRIYRTVGKIRKDEIRYIVEMVAMDGTAGERWSDIFTDEIVVSHRGRRVRPRNRGQKRYLDAIRRSDLVVGIGPAGTGKTYLAMAAAVSALERGLISRIILTRPAVEAGESLGFLPGTMLEKVNPYLRPLMDALHDMMDPERIARCMDRDTVEVAPLAFMRGRTLNDSFVILDEAQNTTDEQMKMLLTRLGHQSKAVVTGDVTQIDLPKHQHSGLVAIQSVLEGIKGIEFVYFDRHDVVRHRLVQDIVEAYERRDRRMRGTEENEIPGVQSS